MLAENKGMGPLLAIAPRRSCSCTLMVVQTSDLGFPNNHVCSQ